jgi:hypothetical protein
MRSHGGAQNARAITSAALAIVRLLRSLRTIMNLSGCVKWLLMQAWKLRLKMLRGTPKSHLSR